jgi:hypothetical protein
MNNMVVDSQGIVAHYDARMMERKRMVADYAGVVSHPVRGNECPR